MGVEIKLNLKEFEKMKEILEYLTSHTIKVGFIGGESNNGTKVSEYAFYVELYVSSTLNVLKSGYSTRFTPDCSVNSPSFFNLPSSNRAKRYSTKLYT